MRYGWLLLALGACNGKDEDTGGGETDDTTGDTETNLTCPPGTFAAACVGQQEGSFEGSIEGPITGELDENGFVAVRFETISGTISSPGCIAEDGSFLAADQGLEVVGTYDFTTCHGSGTWIDTNFDYEGTWEIGLVAE